MKQFKPLVFALAILLAGLTTKIATAQFVSAPSTIQTPYGNVTSSRLVYMPMYQKTGELVSLKHTFTIVLENDSTIEVKTRINVSDSVHYLSWGKKENKVVIKPRETKEIYRLDETGRKIAGIPMDSCWLFLADTGKINTYCVTSDIGIEGATISYIQKGENGAIVSLTKENLETMVSDNERALALTKKGKLLKGIKEYNKM